MNKSEMTKELSKPFPAEAIDWRVGATNADKSKGIALAYLQARPVMDRLDEVVGPEGWQDAYVPIQGPNGLTGFICTLSLKIGDEWVIKTDGSDTSDVEPIKGGFSDSFKRAAVKWGIGRYLYDLPNNWYPIEPKGRSHVLKATPTLPTWALPSGKPEPQAVKLEGKPLKVNSVAKALSYPEPHGEVAQDELTAQIENEMADEPEAKPERAKLVDPGIVSVEWASKIHSNSADKAYGNLSLAELTVRFNGLSKSLKDNDLTDEERAYKELKKKAIKVLINAKKDGSIK